MPGARSCSASSHVSSACWSGKASTGRSSGVTLPIVAGTRMIDKPSRGPDGGAGREEHAMGRRPPGPGVLWLVRHGESLGNVADAHAHASGAGRLELDVRDPDVELSETGVGQARALGRWLADLPGDQRPTAVLSSPFARARAT